MVYFFDTALCVCVCVCVNAVFKCRMLRSILFWDVTQRIVVIPYRRFGKTYRSHLQGSRNPSRRLPRNLVNELPLCTLQCPRREQISSASRRKRGIMLSFVSLKCSDNIIYILLLFIIKHAPSPGSDTTYYNVTSYWYLVIGRGCSVCLCSGCRTLLSLYNV